MYFILGLGMLNFGDKHQRRRDILISTLKRFVGIKLCVNIKMGFMRIS